MDHLKKVVNRMIESEKSDHVFITYGCDFAFTQAQINYFFMDNVIRHWNQENENIQMFYSTPSKYLDSLKELNDVYKQENVQMIQNLHSNQSLALQNKTGGKELAQNEQFTDKDKLMKSNGFSIRRDDSFPYAMK